MSAAPQFTGAERASVRGVCVSGHAQRGIIRRRAGVSLRAWLVAGLQGGALFLVGYVALTFLALAGGAGGVAP